MARSCHGPSGEMKLGMQCCVPSKRPAAQLYLDLKFQPWPLAGSFRGPLRPTGSNACVGRGSVKDPLSNTPKEQ